MKKNTQKMENLESKQKLNIVSIKNLPSFANVYWEMLVLTITNEVNTNEIWKVSFVSDGNRSIMKFLLVHYILLHAMTN